MAGDKFLYNNAGIVTEKASNQTSAGAGDAGKVVALNASGDVDISMMPPGVGAEVTVCPAVEDLVAGDWVNMYLNVAALNARKADANNSRPCNGFVLANVTAPADATVYHISNTNNQCAGLTIGTLYYLSDSAGEETDTAPTGAGTILQRLGIATAADTIVFDNATYIVLAA